MLTSRACWFLLGVFLLLSAGLLRQALPLTLIGLALALWFVCQWLLFLVRLPRLRRLCLEREVCDDKTTVATLWAGQEFTVRVRLQTSDWLSSPHLAAADQVPFAVEHVAGSAVVQGIVADGVALEWSYDVRCGPAGVARFEGVRVQAADVQGFFYALHFVRAVVELPVLPVLARLSGQPAAKKRHNLLLPPGIHRFRRPGSGSELLDLRDYLPGDPPKTIAWKVSARRDRLITKEFESEVPLRCTLFVDTSNSVRVPALSGRGPHQLQYGKALDRLVDLAATVLQASAASRDLAGLCLFGEDDVVLVPPSRGGAHRTRCLYALAEAAARPPQQQRIAPEHLLPLAYSFASEVYPELLHPAVNAVPLRMKWLDGFSAYSRRRFGLFERLHRRKNDLLLLCRWASFWAVVVPALLLVFKFVVRTPIANGLLFSVLLLCPLASGLLWASVLALLTLDTAAGWRQRRRERWRKQLAAIVSARYGLAPGGLAALLEDDDAFSLYLQRFLGEHRLPYTLPLYSEGGRYLFAAPAKVPVLADALLRAVGRGRDNELFVLAADLLELDDCLDSLLRAVRVALGRHHQVILLCPWPPGLELPDSASGTANTTPLAESSTSALWDEVTTTRFQLAFYRLRRTFARLGVAVLCAAGEEPALLILRRLERLRTLGRPHS